MGGVKEKVKRFWSYTKPMIDSGCILWMASSYQNGYGHFRGFNKNKMECSHRIAWEITNGPIPNGMHVLHRCDTPACVNPNHLFLGTRSDNMMDCVNKNRAKRIGAKGESNSHAKLTKAEIIEIRNSHKTPTELSIEYGVTLTNICDIINRKTWRHV